jgi:type IV pilus assembly protein PilQ
MGDVVKRRQSDGWQRLIASMALLMALGGGCTSSKPARVVEATPANEPAATADTKAAPASAEIRTLDLHEGAPGELVELDASAPLVWTSFRNAEGQVVVELPNALPKAGLADLAPEDGLVASLKIQSSSEGNRPLTRLIITTRGEVEHSVSADGNRLQVRLVPEDQQVADAGNAANAANAAGSGKAKKSGLELEPLGPDSPRDDTSTAAAPAEPAVRPAVEPESAHLQEPAPSEPVVSTVTASGASSAPSSVVGTPDRPAVGPAPSGVAATRLDAVEVLSADGGAVIRIAGDGEFPYSTFALQAPDRFVIDLDGVVNRAQRPTVSVDGSVVERVRVAQFKPLPKPVSRVVFDLRAGAAPSIERTADGLVVSFPGSGASSAGMAAATAPAVSPPAPRESSAPASAPSAPAARPSTPSKTPRTTAPAAPSAQPSDLALAQKSAPATDSAIQVEEAPATPTPSTTVAPRPTTAPKSPPTVKVRPSTAPATVQTEVPATGGNLNAAIDSFQSQAIGSGERTYVGEPIDLNVTNADVTDVVRSFAQISGLNVIVQPGVTGQVTAEMENVPWDQALEEILKINNLGYELEGNVMRIAPVSVLRQEAQEKQQLAQAKALSIPLRTIFRRLSYANAGQLANLLRSGQAGLLSQRGSVIVDDRTNSLIIKELPAFMDTVISIIDRLDTPEPQVMIEARIIETTKRFSRDFGITWGFDAISSAATGNTTGLIFPNNGHATGGVNLPGGGDNGTINLRLGNVLNTFNLDIALQAAESEGLINILSAPKVATLNNQQASIQSGLQIPIQTISNNTVTVQYVSATLQLQVTPQVTAEGTVMMDISISKREPQLAFLVPGATNAPIATKEATTRLLVRDGGTAVIGGIYKVSTDQGEDRVPGLANIPIIGNLFKNKSRSETNDELLIFITPRVIKI